MLFRAVLSHEVKISKSEGSTASLNNLLQFFTTLIEIFFLYIQPEFLLLQPETIACSLSISLVLGSSKLYTVFPV